MAWSTCSAGVYFRESDNAQLNVHTDLHGSAYLSFSMRPVQAWNEINYISRECMLLLKMNWKSTDSSSPDLKARVFWMAWVIEKHTLPCRAF